MLIHQNGSEYRIRTDEIEVRLPSDYPLYVKKSYFRQFTNIVRHRYQDSINGPHQHPSMIQHVSAQRTSR